MEKNELSEKTPLNELDFGSTDDEIEITPQRPKFVDEDEPSDDDEVPSKKNIARAIPNKINNQLQFRPITDYIFANANTYDFKTWHQCFPDNKVCLKSLVFNPAWYEFFSIVEKRPYYKGIERILSDHLAKKDHTIVPHAELVFNSFNVLSPKNIKVVLIGQDPYPGATKINNKWVPQAMGFSFSVPLNYTKPESLANIYKNMVDFGHILKVPDGGCLGGLVVQGFFMINAAFTTFFGTRNAHKSVWIEFTKDLLAYINKKCKNLVFVVWGKDAHMLCLNIDPNKHCIITSSHPSPLAFNKKFNGYTYGTYKNPRDRKNVTYLPFNSTDHFGRMNTYLKSVGKPEIFFDVIDLK